MRKGTYECNMGATYVCVCVKLNIWHLFNVNVACNTYYTHVPT